jgi:hypothetical protein
VDHRIVDVAVLVAIGVSETWHRHVLGVEVAMDETTGRGGHGFCVVKLLWGFEKVGGRGLVQNTARFYTAPALANLFFLRRRVLPAGTECGPGERGARNYVPV